MADDTILHYRILRPLGAGGMGRVVLAEDLTLRRKVALKFLLDPETTDPEQRERLRREARALATLSHPNIASVHALETAGDRSFLVMEYVEGETLADRLAHRPLPIPETIVRGVALAEALAHAHSKGITHRDVKPSNVIVTPEGRTRLTDFGLARVPGATTLTEDAAITGTVEYMSPEQARGERGGARSDLFSLGVLLYEALTGSRPFAGERIEAVLYAIQHSRPEPPSARRTGIPLELERIVLKCMQKDAALRYQHAEDLAADLRALAGTTAAVPLRPAIAGHRLALTLGGAGALVAVAIAVALLGQRLGWWPAAPDSGTVLVLPMDVHGQADGADDAGRAFAEAIAINLSQLRGLSVLPVPEKRELRSRGTLDLARQAGRLGAGRLVTGSLTRSGRSLRASLSLTDVARNRIAWGFQETSEEADMALLASRVVKDLAVRLGVREPAQYEYFRYVAGSPRMAAWPDLARTVGVLRRHEFHEGLRLTARLVEAFPDEPAARVMRLVALQDAGNVYQGMHASWDSMIAGVDALERVDPDNPNVLIFRTQERGRQAREAMTLISSALARDDLTPALRSHALRTQARVFNRLGDTTRAMDNFRESVRLDPANPWAHSYLAEGYASQGRLQEALDCWRSAAAIDPDEHSYVVYQASALKDLGRTDEALAILAQLCQSATEAWECSAYSQALLDVGKRRAAMDAAARAESLQLSGPACYELAAIRAATGDREGAFRLLDRFLSFDPPQRQLDTLKSAKEFTSLHGDPRFTALLRDAARRRRDGVSRGPR